MHEVCYFYVIEPNEDIKTEDYDVVENDEDVPEEETPAKIFTLQKLSEIFHYER